MSVLGFVIQNKERKLDPLNWLFNRVDINMMSLCSVQRSGSGDGERRLRIIQ